MDDQNRALTANPNKWQAYKRRSKLLLLVEHYDNALEDLKKQVYVWV